MLVPAYVQPAAQHQVQPQPPTPATLFRDGSAPVFRACASAMQRPTLTNVRIRSTRDANQIFYAVARNALPMTIRRLDAEERRAIVSGNVYVWEERGANTEATGLGIERWTDGMRWSPSRVRDEFLFYHQKEMDPDEAADLPPTRWARVVRPRASGSDGSTSDASPEKIPHQRTQSDPERLIKQTYSVTVTLPEDLQRGILRKWHLTAYFTQASVDDLSTVDEMLATPHVAVPEGWFRSARAGKARRDTARQKLAQSFGPDMTSGPGPSGSSPSTQTPSSSSYSPQMRYPHVTPHAQYVGYVQEDDNRMQVDVTFPRLPPPGGSYTVPPVPPPPQPAAHARGLGISFERRAQESERDLDRERSEQDHITSALPNMYEPSPSLIVVPSHSHTHPYMHPYANAYPVHLNRTSSSARASGSSYYSPSRSHTSSNHVPVPASSLSRHSGATRGLFPAGAAGQPHSTVATNPMGSMGEDTRHQQSYSQSFPSLDPEWQGRARVPSNPSPRNKSLNIAPSSAALSLPATRQSSPAIPQPRPSPIPGTLRLIDEKDRSLIPLDNLENAIFPRRDPTDDALLRRFNGLRTTPPTGSVVDQ